MRRTYQDWARAAKVHDFVTNAISGHATEEMHQHNSTVAENEMREGLARITSIAGSAPHRCGKRAEKGRRHEKSRSALSANRIDAVLAELGRHPPAPAVTATVADLDARLRAIEARVRAGAPLDAARPAIVEARARLFRLAADWAGALAATP
jgi:hypothetical protein